MKRTAGLLLGLLLPGCSAAAQLQSDEQLIPDLFRGAWGYPGVPCQPNLSDMALRVEEGALYFDEYDGKVRKVTLSGDRTIDVLLDFSGEGHTWTGAARLTLDRSGNELVIRPERNAPRYVRCESPG